MSARSAILWSFRSVGVLLVALNALHLTLGFMRLRNALLEQPIPQRFEDPLRTAWMYIGTLGLVLGVILLWISANAAAGDPVAWKVGVSIGVALVFAGVASYFATGRHPGLLVVGVFGLVLLVPLFVYRSHP